MSDTPMGLQNQLNVLNSACKNMFLNVNTDKTKIMVFRKGGFQGKNEHWNLDGKRLDTINEYNYLGYVFTTKTSVTRCIDVLAVTG